MPRVPFVTGNWKMHKTVGESLELVDRLLAESESLAGVEVGIAPPFTALFAVQKRILGTKLRLAAQNVHFESHGAFTGEVSVGMLKDVGCQYVIIGHSERRTLFGETDEGTKKKVGAVLRAGLRPILCIGETLAERDANQTLAVVSRQLAEGLGEVSPDHAPELVLAYEPVWAIGTGRTATPAQAQEVHAHIRASLQGRFGAGFAEAVRIQYGGSVKPENAKDLFGQADIDGGLIGGASLTAEAFLPIARAAAR
ncbi:MAG: triose-phosphate isomerase [Myxococcota bacterium]